MSYIGVQPGVGQYRKLDDISGSFNGATTTFTTSVGGINVTAGSPQQLLVSVGGVIQQPVTDYSTSTNSITFSTAPAAGLDFFAVLMGDAINIGIPSDGSVTTAKLGADLTVDLASGTAAAPSLTFDSNTGLFSSGADEVAISTGGSQRATVDSFGYLTGTVNGLGNGLYLANQFYRLNSGNVGSNATGAQSVFGVGVSLIANTVYAFESFYVLQKSAGTTSHTIAVSFGGTAGLNNINYGIIWNRDNTTAASSNMTGIASAYQSFATSASSLVLTSAIASSGQTITLKLSGTVSISTAGTFIPQYTLSAAPGGAYTTLTGSYFKIAALGAAGANTSIGSWA